MLFLTYDDRPYWKIIVDKISEFVDFKILGTNLSNYIIIAIVSFLIGKYLRKPKNKNLKSKNNI